MAFLDRVKCDSQVHNETCPQWCDLRPGGATKSVPIVAKATTLFPGDHIFEQGPGCYGVCTCGRDWFTSVHSDYPASE